MLLNRYRAIAAVHRDIEELAVHLNDVTALTVSSNQSGFCQNLLVIHHLVAHRRSECRPVVLQFGRVGAPLACLTRSRRAHLAFQYRNIPPAHSSSVLRSASRCSSDTRAFRELLLAVSRRLPPSLSPAEPVSGYIVPGKSRLLVAFASMACGSLLGRI